MRQKLPDLSNYTRLYVAFMVNLTTVCAYIKRDCLKSSTLNIKKRHYCIAYYWQSQTPMWRPHPSRARSLLLNRECAERWTIARTPQRPRRTLTLAMCTRSKHSRVHKRVIIGAAISPSRGPQQNPSTRDSDSRVWLGHAGLKSHPSGTGHAAARRFITVYRSRTGGWCPVRLVDGPSAPQSIVAVCGRFLWWADPRHGRRPA